MAKDMCKQIGLLSKDGTYYFQARIPKDCAQFFPKPIIRERLSAITLAEAKAQVRQKWAELEAKLAQFRNGSTAEPSRADIKRYADAWLASLLEEDEEVRIEGLSDRDYRKLAESFDIVDAGGRDELARGKTDLVEFEMEDFLESAFGVRLVKGTPAYREAAYAFLKASVKATELMRARHSGEVVETPEPPPLPTARAPARATSEAPLLSEVISYFLDNYDKRRPMYRKHTAVLPLFLEVVRDRPVDQIKQMDIEDFCKLICKLPPRWTDEVRRRKVTPKELAEIEHAKTIAPKTYEDTYIASVRPFLSTAKRIFGDRGFPGHLTTEGVPYRGAAKEGENKQRAFKPHELKALFSALAPSAASRERVHEAWLPLIALYTGARVNEICQLNPHTDISEEGGIPFLHFTEDTEGDERIRKSIKNATSRRRVPVHSELLRLGFMDYVGARRAAGAKTLFPWKPSKGKASYKAEKWFIEFLREVGLRDETPGKRLVGMHAFRSTFMNRAHNLRIRDYEVITGHAGEQSGVVRGYQGELELPHKRDIIERVTFDIDVPRPVRPTAATKK